MAQYIDEYTVLPQYVLGVFGIQGSFSMKRHGQGY